MSSVPSRPPKLVTAYSISSTSLVVKWSHVPRKNFVGKPIGYRIYYNSYMDDNFQFVSVNYTINAITLTNLDFYTEYFIAVAAVSSGGVGPAETTTVTTGESKLLFLCCFHCCRKEYSFHSSSRFFLLSYFPFTFSFNSMNFIFQIIRVVTHHVVTMEPANQLLIIW